MNKALLTNNMKQLKFITYLLLFSIISSSSFAQSRKAIETSTDVLVMLPAVTGFVTTLVKKDYEGTKQIVLSGATNLATSLLLKAIIDKDRPDFSNNNSFPSAHTSIAFQGASFIQRRYGWKYGIPAYIVSSYVGWGRTYAKKHDGWDVLAGAAIGTISSYIFTTPFARKNNFTVSPSIINNQYAGFYATIVF